MKDALVSLLRCAACERVGALQVTAAARDRGEVVEGTLTCGGCGATVPITNAIPRFAATENYARSFGFQWKRHARTQLDRPGSTASADRFFEVTCWPDDLRGQKLLEAGSGAGRFTAIAVNTGAEVYSFDYSDAVDTNLANQGSRANLHLLQADIYRIPLRPASFDKVVCLGVLQHCPDPARAFAHLVAQLAPGGEIVIDVYRFGLRSLAAPKYWLRPITTRMDRRRLHRAVQVVVPALLPLKRWLARSVPLGRYAAYLVPVAYQPAWEADGMAVDPAALVDQSVLDTFDWYAPAFDQPQTLSAVRRWFHDANLTDVFVGYGPNGIVGRGTRPLPQERAR